MIEINKRRIIDICRECIPNIEISKNFRTGESHVDKETSMFLIGNDMSEYKWGKREVKRYKRYMKE